MAAWTSILARIAVLAILTAVLDLARPAGAAAEPGRPVVTDIRVGLEGPRTRLVLEFTDTVKGRLFTLDGPPRVVIDIPEVGWRLPQRPLPSNEGLLAHIRYGLFKPGTTRIVVDLTREATVENAFVLAQANNPPRLVVDLRAESPDVFRAGIDKSRALALATEAPAAAPAAFQAAPPRAAAAPALPPPPAVPARTVAAPVAAAPAAAPAPAPAPAAVPSRVAAAAPAAAAPARRANPPRKKVIVLDPGHGGADPGAISVTGNYEKHLTLAFARELKAEIDQLGRYRVVLTRNNDVFIPLRERVAFAREQGGDLFVSLHADAVADPSIRGLSVYTLSQKASDSLAEQLADSENKVDLIGGVDLSRESAEVSNILIDLAQRETMNQSIRFATLTVGEMGREITLLRHAHRQAGFAVLKSADIPSVLVELGFLSNQEEERALRNKSYRKTLTKTIAHAADRFFSRVEEASKP